MKKNKNYNCPACNGIGEIKVIKNIAQIGPFHLGKEVMEKCNFCKTYKNQKNLLDDKFRETVH